MNFIVQPFKKLSSKLFSSYDMATPKSHDEACVLAKNALVGRRLDEDFQPAVVGLRSDFRLTEYTELKGCGCKVPQKDLLVLLEGINNPYIGMDSAIVPLKGIPNAFLVQTTDFFYPLVEDPYLMGQITCANVLSDLYAMGVTVCDNMLMLLGVSTKLAENERDRVTALMMRGFTDKALEAETIVTGGQTVKCPWMLLGGVASSAVLSSDMYYPNNAMPGDVLVLTKPLGGQVAVNAHQMLYNQAKANKLLSVASERDIVSAYNTACFYMQMLNRTAAELMKKHRAHASTDVTGFGILGHANNLARHQTNAIQFVIDNIPVIRRMRAVNDVFDFGLLRGTSSETSGGLLIAFGEKDVDAFIEDYEAKTGTRAWKIGRVINSKERQAIMSDALGVIEAEHINAFTIKSGNTI